MHNNCRQWMKNDTEENCLETLPVIIRANNYDDMEIWSSRKEQGRFRKEDEIKRTQELEERERIYNEEQLQKVEGEVQEMTQ